MYNIEDDIQEVLYSKEELQNKVQELGAQIARDYEDKQLMVVGILKGANIFTADLCRAIPGRIQMEFMVVSSYGTSAVSSGR
jgi:hypoxanthine phosphoribosyltransferase